jgi:nickel/cobalt exporter
MMELLIRLQRGIHETISADLVSFADTRNWMAFLAVLPLGIAFGAVHALTPGHGKSILASYLLGSRLAAMRATLVAILLTLTHIGSAVVLARVAAPLVTRTLVGVGRVPSLELVSRCILIAIGLWLTVHALRQRAHVHGEGIAVSLAAGIVPCPLTLFAMFYALAHGVPEAGLAFAVAMLFGVGFTLVLVALLTVFARDWVLGFMDRQGASLARVTRTLDGVSGCALALVAARELLS